MGLNRQYLEGADLSQLLSRLRQEQPLVHCITNYVTVNDVANMILAAGASPIMADAEREMPEITALSKALVLNLGTLNERAVGAMLAAGREAARLGHPIIMDPVGAGASTFRSETARQLMAALPCTVIRGNASEIRTLAGAGASSQGVDAGAGDQVGEESRLEMKELLCSLSRRTGAVIVMTGAIDMVADSQQMWMIRNGAPMMARVTGMGCMLDGLLGAFQAVSVADRTEAASGAAASGAAASGAAASGAATSGAAASGAATSGAAAVSRVAQNQTTVRRSLYAVAATSGAVQNQTAVRRSIYAVAAAGICGQIAAEMVRQANGGTGSFRMYYLDAMSRLADQDIQGGAIVEI